MEAAHIPGRGDAISSLLSVRAELVEQVSSVVQFSANWALKIP